MAHGKWKKQPKPDPCPCCGSGAKVEIEKYKREPQYVVQCQGCGMMSDFYDFRKQALDAWNRRAT